MLTCRLDVSLCDAGVALGFVDDRPRNDAIVFEQPGGALQFQNGVVRARLRVADSASASARASSRPPRSRRARAAWASAV
jgi:hypothetical protein